MSEPVNLRSLSTEAHLLFLLLGRPDRHDLVRELVASDELNWGAFCWLAQREAATPVIWQHLKVATQGQIPDEIGRHFEKAAMVAEFKQAYLEQRLTEVVRLLSEAEIRVLLLKGAALVQRVYGSFVQRPMADLDLLVDAERAEEAQSLMLRNAWTLSEVEKTQEFYAGHHHLPPLDDARGTGLGLEFHTDLFFDGHPFDLSPAMLWEEARPVQVGGYPALVPSDRHQLLHLCLHFAWSHMLTSSSWRTFRDLRALITAGAVEWEVFIDLAVATRAGSCCYWTFRLARKVGGVEIPDEVLHALRPPGAEVVLNRVEQHFLSGLLPSPAACPSVGLARTFWEVGLRPGWSGHASVRPWQRSEQAHSAFLASAPNRGLGKVGFHLRNLRAWREYLRTLLQPTMLAGIPVIR